ncbi:MAG: CatB-related O-acetyltransferase [Firmicutes bacterium]|nr:CatB-related O-acetyltransferase [Bacillota bacterium]
MLVIIGENSGITPFHYQLFGPNDVILVGKWSGMSLQSKILGGGEHHFTNVSNLQINSILNMAEMAENNFKGHSSKNNFMEGFMEWYDQDLYTRGPTIIGNDVLATYNAIILSGVKIGDGALIGAGAVVRKDIPPYAIVAGNPARVAGYRFSEEQIKALLRIRWWDWSFEELLAFKEYFAGDVDTFISKAFEKMKEEGRL